MPTSAILAVPSLAGGEGEVQRRWQGHATAATVVPPFLLATQNTLGRAAGTARDRQIGSRQQALPQLQRRLLSGLRARG